jgi:hypothetical protein
MQATVEVLNDFPALPLSVEAITLDRLWRAPYQKIEFAPQIRETARAQCLSPERLRGKIVSAWLSSPLSEGFAWNVFFSSEISVSGLGSLWIGDVALIHPQLIPEYWRLKYFSNYSNAAAEVSLLEREIEEPCVCLVAWGWDIYGHFLIEGLPKLLACIELLSQEIPDFKVLVRSDAPRWYLDILNRHFCSEDRLISYDAKSERIRLLRGIYPGYPNQAGFFHPKICGLYHNIKNIPEYSPYSDAKLFITRKFLSPARIRARLCENEEALHEIAVSEFGYTIYAPEKESWADQVACFRSANTIVGVSGSALHTSILAGPRLKIGCIGAVNRAQFMLASLTGQSFASIADDVDVLKPFSINADEFRIFLSALDDQ